MIAGKFTKSPVQVSACLSKVITAYRDQSGCMTMDNYVGGGHPKIICTISKQAWLEPCEATENLYLIAEAFNVANQTGLTPKHVLDQRDALLAALRMAVGDLRDMNAPSLEVVERALKGCEQ